MRVALFARQQHYRNPQTGSSDFNCHGYVIAVVTCFDEAEENRVREHIEKNGFKIWGASGNTWWDEWYGGGPYSFDFLGSFDGTVENFKNKYDPAVGPRVQLTSRQELCYGDARWFCVIDAKRILGDAP